MSTELENPVINDEAEAKLLEAAGLADAGRDIPSDLLPEKPAEKEETLETEENVPTEAELADPANKDRARDPVSGKFIKRPAAAQVAPTESGDASKAVPESDYAAKQRERKEKETARLDKTWENVNRQKEELEARRMELQQYEQQLRQPQQPRQQQARQFSSHELLNAHDDFKAKAKSALDAGDYDTFNEQNALAEQAFNNATQFFHLEQQEAQQAQMQQHGQTWNQHMVEAIKSDPDLSDSSSALSKEVQQILQVNGKDLWMFPDGFNKAVELARLRIDAREASTLRERVKALEEAKQAQDALLAPSKGGVTSPQPTTGKTFDKMTTEEQERHVLAMAERMDSGQ